MLIKKFIIIFKLQNYSFTEYKLEQEIFSYVVMVNIEFGG
jgi:hypothetical protein